ncbi:MAG: hypothetical protein R3C11_24640 [Planctomycetaceae bacterium]
MLQLAVRNLSPKCRKVLEDLEDFTLLKKDWTHEVEFLEAGLLEAVPILGKKVSSH